MHRRIAADLFVLQNMHDEPFRKEEVEKTEIQKFPTRESSFERK